ncbi:gluconolactonase [Corallococcus sp. AB004]|uniref:L-dopachrome tautomerase-related protein n=1 Tax=Corallococcus TaxID=83461 RepID=UPI000EA045EB|nr:MULTISPECIES: L-dopachrome tautomerase-related protein [Corallococcus]RKI49027.1 gluconolactonase [Corallococcus sp. AB004]NNB84836.1 gluconolactonase [Corallococcus exiguus]NPC69054.1 gluconolactonase [Corallococcus exiguus]NPD23088.1 gluconolactonase [Corallococcus exiguus]RKI03892.1 gluconolactonase [Corallococcus sp. AB038B]
MRFHHKVGVLALALASLTAWAEDAVDFSTRPTGTLEVVARFDGPGPSGIAVTPDGRVFVGFPRHAEDHKGATLAELVQGTLVPFPTAAMSLPSNAPAAQRLLSVHGMTTDTKGNVWVIDDGKRAGIQGIPDGGAKVVGFNPATREVIASVVIRAPALLPDSHLNDLRVDLTHGAKGTAYISDSSFGTSPALVVVDLATGRQRRVLATHPSTQPEQDFLALLEGKPLRYDPKHPTFPVGGADGIALSTDSRRLYYAPLTSRRLYSIPTDVVSDLDVPERTLAAAVKDEGEKGFADGLAMDTQDRLYITDGEHHSILRRWPDGHFDVVARDARIVWPDGIFATAGHVYVTLGQWNRLPSFNGGKDLREPPYLLMRAPLETTAPVDATRMKK